jgi:two-component system cell cycle response regulator CpdR
MYRAPKKGDSGPIPGPTPNPRRILLVDDERSIRKLLTIAFTDAGYEVYSAASAIKAMAMCASERFDVLLSDVTMPEMNGQELVRRAAAQYPDMRCCLMSGFDLECDGCRRAPCALLPKPFKPQDAIALIAQILGDPLVS